ncbi:MAG: TonB-dependent receptor, partial [Muribaculaceae bacterium]|nr:TonB-dependent receptor [Muribaculaceae bacterium]
MIDYLGIDDDTDMRYKHVTQVGAAYVSYTFHSGPWDARAGLRYEHSFLRATYPDGQQDPYEAHLNDWVPSASLRISSTGLTASNSPMPPASTVPVSVS